MVAKEGYPSETYTVTTDDGYILEMHRIPHGKNENGTQRPVAFLMHGLFCSSADWVVAGPGKGLGTFTSSRKFRGVYKKRLFDQPTSLLTLDTTFGWATTGATRILETTCILTRPSLTFGSSVGIRWVTMICPKCSRK